MRLVLLAGLLLVPAMLLAQQDRIGGAPADPQKARLQAVGRAKVQLSLQLAVPESRMTLDSATAATWPDASLGCPEKGHMYAQVVTRGWVVRLRVADALHEVHVAGKRTVVCRAPREGGR